MNNCKIEGIAGDVFNGISCALHETFGDEYTIYTESIKQGFKEPCFHIIALQPTNEQAIDTYYLRDYPMNIMYFPKDENHAKTEMYNMAERLFLAVEYIKVLDNLRRASKMRYEIVDGVLHFFVTYSMYVKEITAAEPAMETLEYNATLEEHNDGN